MYNPTKPYLNDVRGLIESTWNNNSLITMDNEFFIKNFIGLEYDHTDGIGTKGIFHWQYRTFANAVKDAMAMNLNDLAMMRSIPYKMQSHIMLPEEDNEAIKYIFKSMNEECDKYGIVLTGGETAIHNNMKGMEISITMSGRVIYSALNLCKTGDVLIGFPSDGLHSNGFTKVQELSYLFGKEQLTTPTKVYFQDLLKLMGVANGLIHITGGGLSKIRRILNANDAIIRITPFEGIFKELNKGGVSEREMYSTFNCGIGFIISVDPKDVENVLKSSKEAYVVGSIENGSGKVVVNSMEV